MKITRPALWWFRNDEESFRRDMPKVRDTESVRLGGEEKTQVASASLLTVLIIAVMAMLSGCGAMKKLAANEYPLVFGQYQVIGPQTLNDVDGNVIGVAIQYRNMTTGWPMWMVYDTSGKPMDYFEWRSQDFCLMGSPDDWIGTRSDEACRIIQILAGGSVGAQQEENKPLERIHGSNKT